LPITEILGKDPENLQSTNGIPLTNIGAIVVAAAHLLSSNGDYQTARIEAEVLVRQALSITRGQLYSRLDSEFPSERMKEFLSMLQRRIAGEPVAYIIGHREFYGLDFLVDPRVLVPRPETELVVEAVLSRFEGNTPVTIADVGTGSGAIAVSLAVSLPGAEIFAIDCSAAALEVAAVNVARHGVDGRVRLVQGDLLQSVHSRLDIVVANLPYVPHPRLGVLPRDVRDFEPLSALDGGEDGLDHYRRLLVQARERADLPKWITIEIDPEQRESISEFAYQLFPSAKVHVLKDYAGMDRVISVDTVCA